MIYRIMRDWQVCKQFRIKVKVRDIVHCLRMGVLPPEVEAVPSGLVQYIAPLRRKERVGSIRRHKQI